MDEKRASASGRGRFRRAAYVVAAIALVISTSGSTQSLSGDPTGALDVPNGTNGQTGQTTRTSSSRQTAREAAATQLSTQSSDTRGRYQPDTIASGDPSARSAEAPAPSGTTDLTDDDRDAIRDRALAARQRAIPSEFERFVSDIVDKPLRRFGSNLLVPGARDFTAPPTTTIPTDYRINPGDELVIGISGSIEASNLRLIVNSDGRVFLPRVGAVDVVGVRYGDLESALSRQISRVYRNFRVEVAIGRLHGITVYVTGFAATPGSYTVSSLSTLVNAVLSAGGPSAGGSFRSIQLRRNGRLISDFDLYDLLLRGDKSGDAVLQNGDVIYIAPVGAQVAVIGSVNNEAIFEAGAKDSLTDILLYAGGANTVSDNGRLLVINPLKLDASGGWEELTPEQAQTRLANRGEIIRVLSGVGIARPLSNQPIIVTISGEVALPGRYYFKPGTTVGQLVTRAGGLTRDAFPYASVITRESVRQQQRVSFKRALEDLELQLTTHTLVMANRGTAVSQGSQEGAIRSIVEQLKARDPDGRLVFDIPVTASVLPADLILENNDTVYVPPRSVSVGVFGAVPSPASFAYRPGRKVSDYLDQAGGVQKLGDRSAIFVVRANGTLVPRKKALGAEALPGDLVFVPINADRGEFWARLRDITSVLFSGAVTAATISSLTN